VAVVKSVDCLDRYFVRISELRASVRILELCVRRFPKKGEIKSASKSFKVTPSKNAMKASMESTIQHFKSMAGGLALPKTDIYTATEAPKGEFGLFISANGTNMPSRVKIRAPGFFHLQGVKTMSYQHLLADLLTIIGTADIVFGEVDR
jgi:NADH:ubiquinone oxidoreductase subunit D